jgi:hypothetical protein
VIACVQVNICCNHLCLHQQQEGNKMISQKAANCELRKSALRFARTLIFGYVVSITLLSHGVEGNEYFGQKVIQPTNMFAMTIDGSVSLRDAVERICTNSTLTRKRWRESGLVFQSTNSIVVSVASSANEFIGSGFSVPVCPIEDALRIAADLYHCHLLETREGAIFFPSNHYYKRAMLMLSGLVRYANTNRTVSKLELVWPVNECDVRILLNNGKFLCAIEMWITVSSFSTGVRSYDWGEESLADRYPRLKWVIDGREMCETPSSNLVINAINSLDIVVP